MWKDQEAKSSAFERKHTGHSDQPTGTRKRRGRAAARAHRNLKPMRFVSLHHHSTFSYLDGFQLPEAHVRRATEINMGTMALTEHGNVSSHVKLEKAAEAEGIKPIFGCEVYMGRLGKQATQKKYHLTILAATDEGYRNLMALVSRSYSEGFYYEPTVTPQMLRRYRRGLIILSGCLGSLLACSFVGGKLIAEEDASYRRGLKVMRYFRDRFGDAYYAEVQAFPQLEKTRKLNPMMAQAAGELGVKLIATKDCHYTVPTESEIQKVLHNVRPGEKKTLEDMERDWGYDVPLCPPSTDKSIYRDLVGTGLTRDQAIESIVSTEEVAQRCTVSLPKLPRLRYPLPRGYTSRKTLWRDWLRQGWRYRNCHTLSPRERRRYKARLKYEMELIESKDFLDYFLVVSDSVKWAKDHGIPVGPARGSAAASLCCWLLRITEVNPMLFPNMLFERFIDVSRDDEPDIDLDFDADRRHEVRDYLVSKYGAECVNNIGTFSYYKSRLALDDVAKVHKVPEFEVEKIKGVLVERSSGDLRASATIEDTVEYFDEAGDVVERYPALRKAMELEGNVKQFGVHAAGLAVSNGDIRDVCAVYEREVQGRLITCVSMDKFDAARQGLLKLDYLGLRTMAMIAEALRQLDMKLEDLYAIPLDQKKVLDGFRRNDVTGIFQFDGRATRSVCGSLKPDTFNEICDIAALSRPGPLHSGAAQEYIEVRHGRKEPDRLHPALDAITQSTQYQIVYQEQILRVVTVIGGFDWTHASLIRQIISKKKGEQEFNRQWERFRKGARKLHRRSDFPPMSDEVARRIWGSCITSGSYAFNAPHCVSYGMLAYWTQWIKQNHPAVFYAASLAKMSDTDNRGIGRHETLMRDAIRGHGPRKPVKLLPPHPSRSLASWRALDRRKLLAGFAQVDGIGESTATKIVAERNGHATWESLGDIKGVGPKTIERLVETENSDDPFGVYALDRKIKRVAKTLRRAGLPKPTHAAIDIPYEKGADIEVVWLGVVTHRNLRDIFESHRSRTGEELDPAGVKQPELNEFVVMVGYDGDEVVSLRIPRHKYARFRKAVWGMKLGEDVVLVRGVRPGWRSARELYLSEMWVLEP